LAAVVNKLPIGTNLALHQFLWMLVSGALLSSRGALFPALQAVGLKEDEVRRAWSAFRYGAWSTTELVAGMAHTCGGTGAVESATIRRLLRWVS